MARRKHFWGRSPLPHDGGPRLWRMVLFLVVLAMMYTQMRRPSNWSWLAGDAQAQSSDEKVTATTGEDALPADAPPAAPEMLRAGPTDREEWENRPIKDSLAVVTDKTDLKPAEMPAYWNLMRWTLAQSSADLERRAARDVSMDALRREPEKYRGTLVRIPLEVRRILSFETDGKNSAELKTGYEMMGMSAASKALPYWVIVPEIPADWKTGDEAYESGTFVGYFLKWQWYQASNGKDRAMPLLIGRIIPAPKRIMKKAALQDDPLFLGLLGVGALAVVGFAAWLHFSPRPSRAVISPSRDEETAVDFLRSAFQGETLSGDAKSPPTGEPVPPNGGAVSKSPSVPEPGATAEVVPARPSGLNTEN